MHLAIISLLYYQWTFKYFLFGRHIMFSAFMPIIFEIVHMCLMPMKSKSWQPKLFYICKPFVFFHIYDPFKVFHAWLSIFNFCEKWSFQDHLATKAFVSTQNWFSQENSLKLSPHDLNKLAESSTVLLRNGLFKTILPLKLVISTWCYVWLKALVFPRTE